MLKSKSNKLIDITVPYIHPTKNEQALYAVIVSLINSLRANNTELNSLLYNPKNNGKEYGYWPSTIYDIAWTIAIMKFFKRKNIIDLGAGIGLFLRIVESLSDEDIKIKGIENEQVLVNASYAVLPCIKLGDITKLEVKDFLGFDTIYIWEPLKRSDNMEEKHIIDFVDNLTKIIKKGTLIIYKSAGLIGEFLRKTNKYQICHLNPHMLTDTIPLMSSLKVFIKL